MPFSPAFIRFAIGSGRMFRRSCSDSSRSAWTWWNRELVVNGIAHAQRYVLKVHGLVQKVVCPGGNGQQPIPAFGEGGDRQDGMCAIRRSFFHRRQTSNPPIRGIMTSNRVTSGRQTATCRNASSPFLASAIRCPRASNGSRSSRRFSSSSSRISTNPRQGGAATAVNLGFGISICISHDGEGSRVWPG